MGQAGPPAFFVLFSCGFMEGGESKWIRSN